MGILEVAKEIFINQGREEGRREAIWNGIGETARNRTKIFITNMITLTDCSDEEVSKLVEAPLLLVQQMRSELNTKS